MIIGSALFYSCEKFLDAKPYNSLTHPNSLKDLRELLDFEWEVNYWYPGIGELASDDFTISFTGFSMMPPYVQDAYLWEDKTGDSGEWQLGYKMISIANVILEGLERIDGGNPDERKQLEGEALFLRGWVFFNLAQIYCTPFSILDPSESLGLVLRRDSDSEVKETRASLKETYDQLFSDLNRSVELLPETSPYITRASKLVGFAALARAYHTIEDYEMAEKMVGSVMQIESRLLDYNDLDYSLPFPLDLTNNVELFNFAAARSADYLIYDASTSVSPDLYLLYEENDLRKDVFFEELDSGIKFKGFYHGMRSAFLGLAMDEMYLIKAECLVRRNVKSEAASYLNTLLLKRYEKGKFVPLSFETNEALLIRILQERRKELVFRGIRWLDLRRLNRYPKNATILVKSFEDVEGENIYRLMPNDLKYTFLIPKLAIDAGKYVQNPR